MTGPHPELERTLLALVNEQRDVLELDEPLELDSFELIVLIESLEARLGLVVPARDVTPEHFRNVRALASYVAARRQT